MRCLGITPSPLILTGRPSGPPLPGDPQTQEKISESYPIITTLPSQCPCSPETESRSPASLRSSTSPRPLSPGGPDDLSVSKNSSQPDHHDINNGLNVNNN
ncbi:hypothetical protein BDFB_012785 [Asbolus verrucosus]|uniref:Uncharacterized protein n=1 Tax=Asbolus verrucosus TaxID=1661398 RepID=A0A482W5U5_ASBVE|nr:hypothetical protein BDFB_012785 [Asbolus verrucosus]